MIDTGELLMENHKLKDRINGYDAQLSNLQSAIEKRIEAARETNRQLNEESDSRVTYEIAKTSGKIEALLLAGEMLQKYWGKAKQ